LSARLSVRIVPLLLFVAIAAVFVWQRASSQRARVKRAPAAVSDQDRADARNYMQQYYAGRSPTRDQALANRRIPVEARWFATHSARVGDYIVALRHLIGGDRGIAQASTSEAPLASYVELGLQFFDLKSPSKPRAEIDLRSLRMVDASGRPLRLVRTEEGGISEAVTVPGGVVYLHDFKTETDTGDRIGAITGKIVEEAPGAVPKRFEIRNVPLFQMPRLFGEYELLPIPADRHAGLPKGLISVPPELCDVLKRESIPSLFPSPLPKPRLLICRDIAGRFELPVDGIVAKISAQKSVMGSMQTVVRIGDEEWFGTLWDHEPIWLALPEGRGRRIAMKLTLSHEPRMQSDPGLYAASAFPPASGKPSGGISAEVKVENSSFGPGLLPVRLWRLEESGRSLSTLVQAPISNAGILRLHNLAVGRYRMEPMFDRMTPRQPWSNRPVTLTEYLLYRFSCVGGQWQFNPAQDILVRPGQTTTLPPMILSNTMRVPIEGIL
jgi:hypothetical protein